MKKILSIVLCLATILCACGLFAHAAAPERERTVTVFPDGSYCITTITVEASEAVATMASGGKVAGILQRNQCPALHGVCKRNVPV